MTSTQNCTVGQRELRSTLDADSRPAVEIRDVDYCRGGKKIFAGLTLNIPRGKVTAIMGPSGTGKTTLLNLITGQLRPDSGSILIGGRSVCPCSRRHLYEMRKGIGVLFQNGALLTNLNVFENVAFPLREHSDLPESLIRQIVLMKLQAVGLRGTWQLMPSELSGGMARRVALARALVMDPKLIIYDEPFVGLDPISMGIIVRLIRCMNDVFGLTSIVVTHDVAQTAVLADCSYLLAGGKVIGAGTPQDLMDNRSDVVKQFMSGVADGPVPFHYPAPDYSEQLLSMANK